MGLEENDPQSEATAYDDLAPAVDQAHFTTVYHVHPAGQEGEHEEQGSSKDEVPQTTDRTGPDDPSTAKPRPDKKEDFSPQEYLQTMPDGARKILSAAQKIVFEQGARALSVSTIAREAGVSKANILYHYGSKENLISTLVAGFMSAERRQEAERLAKLPAGSERLGVYYASQKELIKDIRSTISLFELVPRAFHHDEFTEAMRGIQKEYVQEAVEAFSGKNRSAEDKELLAYCTVAFSLGLSLFYAINEDDDMIDRAVDLSEKFMESELDANEVHPSLLKRLVHKKDHQ